MALYSIADFIIDIQNQHEYIDKQCADYIYEGDGAVDFTVHVSEDSILKERLASEEEYSDGYIESVCAYRELCLKIPLYEAMLLHASVIAYEGRGVAFLARSGVGKTTHTLLWKRLFGEEVTIINGDKPIIRFLDDNPYAYGTPWAGKENLQTNDKILLTDICFIERSLECSVFSAEKEKYLTPLMMQVLRPREPETALKTLELVDKLISKCNMWVIQCDISKHAVQLAHDTIFGG